MFKLRIVQANFGDCFIIEYGTASAPRYALIDGGPENVFDRHLKRELQTIADTNGKFDLVAISHVDGDHISGLQDMFALLREQRERGESELIAIDALWHNSFASAIDRNNEIRPRLAGLMAMANMAAPHSATTIFGIDQGNKVRQLAVQLGIPANQGFANDLICVDAADQPVEFGNLTLQIVGPTQANLDELRNEWIEWLDEFGPDLASGNPLLMANADQSIPNLSSVMFLAEAHGKTILFTGDGRSDHLLEGLETSNLLDGNGGLHVNVLKVMHHGSDRNATKTFFKKVTADTYVISANGHPDNPDLATLIWIVETAKDQGRPIHLIFTNQTPATRNLVREYPPNEFGYEMTVFQRNQNSMVLDMEAL